MKNDATMLQKGIGIKRNSSESIKYYKMSWVSWQWFIFNYTFGERIKSKNSKLNDFF